jgi:CBS domain-containing protein
VAVKADTRPGTVTKKRRFAIPAREAIALAGSLMFIAFGFGAILLAAKVAGVKDGIVLASLLILPAILYLVLSGRVSDLRGPGGLEVTLSEVASTSITVYGEGESVALAYDQVRSVKAGRSESFLDHIRDLTPDDPIVLTLALGSGPINGAAAAEYAKGLTQFPRFRFVAVVDSHGSLISYMEESAFRHAIESDFVDTQMLLNNIEHKNVGAVRAYPGMIHHTVSPGTSIAEALRQMQRLRKSALLVADDGQVRGIIERDRIANALLLSVVDHVLGGPSK